MADIEVGAVVRVRMDDGEILSGEVRAILETPSGMKIRLLVGNVLYHVDKLCERKPLQDRDNEGLGEV
jgi:hypothetical protein